MQRRMRVLYSFSEPLPMPHVRGVQVAHAVEELAESGVAVDLAYVPHGERSPLEALGNSTPTKVTLLPLSHSWPAPLNHLPPFSRAHSVHFFHARLQRLIAQRSPNAIYVRHLKLAHLLLASRKTEVP